MIDFLKQWTLGVCAAAIFCAVIFAVVPNNNLKKSVRLVLSAVMISAMLLPFADGLKKLKISPDLELPQDYSEIQDDSQYNLTAAISDEITAKIDSLLCENGYSDCEINISIGQSDDGIVTIKRVDIKIPNSQRIDSQTQTKLYNLLGEETLIVFS